MNQDSSSISETKVLPFMQDCTWYGLWAISKLNTECVLEVLLQDTDYTALVTINVAEI